MQVQRYLVTGLYEASWEIAGEPWMEIIRANSEDEAMQILVSSLAADNISGYDKVEISPLRVIGVPKVTPTNPS